MIAGENPRDVLHKLVSVDADLPDDLDELTLWKIIIGLVTEPPRRDKLQHVNTLHDVIHLLKTCSKIMVLTGAGVSTQNISGGKAFANDLGVPDYRTKLLRSIFYNSVLCFLLHRCLYRVVSQTFVPETASMLDSLWNTRTCPTRRPCLTFATFGTTLNLSSNLPRCVTKPPPPLCDNVGYHVLHRLNCSDETVFN